MYAIHHDQNEVEKALALAKGEYQRNIIAGLESLSGSTLRGKAKQFSGKYAKSRGVLLARMRDAGVVFHEQTGDHGKRILVIGAPKPATTLDELDDRARREARALWPEMSDWEFARMADQLLA